MKLEEAKILELSCEKILSDATLEKCMLSMTLNGNLSIRFGEHNIAISKYDLRTPEWVRYQGDYGLLMGFIEDVKNAIESNKEMFESLMWSYEHYKELER